MKVLVGLIAIIAVLVLAGLAGTVMMRDPGLVVLSYGGHMFETGLWTFLLVAVVLFLAVRFVISTIYSLLSSGRIFGRWSAKRRRFSAKRQTEQGLLLMAEEEWADARKSLVSGAKGTPTPLLNFLQAAYASNELGQIKRRDELLKQAAKATPDAQFALDLAAARMQLEGDGSEADAALTTLLNLRDQAPRHQIVAEHIARAYEKKGDFSALETQLSGLKRMRKEHPADVARMELAIARHKVLGAFRKDADAAGAVAVWKRQDTSVRLTPEFVRETASELAAAGAIEQAGDVLIDALSNEWRADWISQFANLPGVEKLQAKQASSWLKSQAGDPVVQLLAARAAAESGDWSRARDCAQKSDELQPSAAARIELARAAAALGDQAVTTESAEESAKESTTDDASSEQQP